MHPPRLHVIGRKNSGKTTLIVELIRRLTACGLRVATIKHTHHAHELDVPGKDSHRHRTAGAAAVAIIARNMTATFRARTDEPVEQVYAALQRDFSDCDVVLVEGDVRSPAAKIEVWRAACGEPPLASQGVDVLGVVSDDPVSAEVPVFSPSDLDPLVEWLRRWLEQARDSEG